MMIRTAVGWLIGLGLVIAGIAEKEPAVIVVGAVFMVFVLAHDYRNLLRDPD